MFASIGFLLIIGLITNDDVIKIHKKLSLEDYGNLVGQYLVEHEKRNRRQYRINFRCIKW